MSPLAASGCVGGSAFLWKGTVTGLTAPWKQGQHYYLLLDLRAMLPGGGMNWEMGIDMYTLICIK